MGYYAEGNSEDFCLKKENFDAAFKALLELNSHNELKHGGSFGGDPTEKPSSSKSNGTPDKWFSWMPWNYDELAHSLDDILGMDGSEPDMYGLGFEITYADNGDIVDLAYYDLKIGDETVFFEAIAPYIEPGSIINWTGEDGDHWRWYFDGQTMQEQDGRIVYDDPSNHPESSL